MKNISSAYTRLCIFTLLIFSTNILVAQTNAPYEMMVNGVKVIVQPTVNEIVEIQTVIKGGVQNYSFAQQGIESLAMSALTECGTKNDDKNSFKNKLDKVSAYIYGNSGMDYSTIHLNCIKSDLDVVWPLYVDAIRSPKFDGKEFDRIKQDAINNLKSQASQPDYAITQLAKQTAFKGKDYAKSPEGNEASVKLLTADQTAKYYASILTKSRLLIVVVANIEKDKLTAMLTRLLSNLPEGAPFQLKKTIYQPTANSFTATKSDLATNYIQGITSAPTPGSKDFNAYLIAMRIFYDRHFLEVRSKNGLSYAPATWFDGGSTPSGNIFVSTTEPDKYIKVAQNLVDEIKRKGFTKDELEDMKTGYLSSFYYRQETNAAQAGSFVSNEVLHNNWKRAMTINEEINKLTTADIDKAFNQYFSNITWAYRGDPSKVNKALFVAPAPTNKKLPASKIIKTTTN